MLVRRENLNDIFNIYQNSFDENFVVALPNYKFFILKNKIVKELNLDEVASLLGVDHSVVYNEYQELFPVVDEPSILEESSNKKGKGSEKSKRQSRSDSKESIEI